MKSLHHAEIYQLLKKNICNENNDTRIWWVDQNNVNNVKCRLIIEKPVIELGNENTKTFEFILRYSKIFDIDVNKIDVEYNLYDDSDLLLRKDNTPFKTIVESLNPNEDSLYLKFIIDDLYPNSDYKINAKIVTNIVDYESDYSEVISFKTLCDEIQFNDCKRDFGPVDLSKSTKVSKKDDVLYWPFYKVKSEDKCGCRPMNEEELEGYVKKA